MPQTRIPVASAEYLSFVYLRNLLKRVRVCVHDILSNVSPNILSNRVERVHNVSANVSDREPKMWQKIENNWFFEEKIQILVANALRKSEHF